MAEKFKGATFDAKPSRPAPMANFEPSQKVRDGLAVILPKIYALKDLTVEIASPPAGDPLTEMPT